MLGRTGTSMPGHLVIGTQMNTLVDVDLAILKGKSSANCNQPSAGYEPTCGQLAFVVQKAGQTPENKPQSSV